MADFESIHRVTGVAGLGLSVLDLGVLNLGVLGHQRLALRSRS